MATVATSCLRDWKQYEVVEPANDGLDYKSLYDWADISPVDAVPPANDINLLTMLGERYHADGILVLQGYQKLPSTWNVALTVATASLSWPLLLAEAKGELKADLLESASGRLVWKSRLKLFDPSKPVTATEVTQLIGPIENAVPAALVKTNAPVKQ